MEDLKGLRFQVLFCVSGMNLAP